MNAMIKDEAPKYRMVIDWSIETNEYRVSFPELPHCRAAGKTLEEAAHNGQVAVETHIREMIAGKTPVPKALANRKFSGNLPLRLDPDLHREIAIKAYQAGMSLNKFIEHLLKQNLRD